jgi:predicted DNA-binding transcriptional regulator AlpA
VECLKNDMRSELELVLAAARELPTRELPRLLGDLEEIKCTALARLTSVPAQSEQPDALLDVAEASRRLGTSPDYLYRHSKDFSFTRRLGRKLLFSASGIERYIKQHIRIDSKASLGYAQPVGIPTRGRKV